jgi:HK97 family phage major capsid protein
MPKTMIEKATEERDRHLAVAERCLTDAGDEQMDERSWDKYQGAIRKAKTYSDQLEMLNTTTVTVKSEPRTYDLHSPNSYFLDLAWRGMATPGDPRYEEAMARLTRHRIEVDVEAQEGRSEEGRRARQVFRDEKRNPEQRAMDNTTGSGGSFVTPQYVISAWVPYRSADRSFANQCLTLPLPAYGLTINVPTFASATVTSTQTVENTGVAGSTPTGNDATTSIVTQAGQVSISQQLLDRGGYEGQGGGFDVILAKQIGTQLDADIDTYILTQALANAIPVNQSTPATITQFWLDLATARNNLTDALGVRMAGSHVFSTSDFAGYITSQVDSEGRPIVLPDPAALADVNKDPEWAGWLGLYLPGALRWFMDDNISLATAPTSETTILVGTPQDMLVWEGEQTSYSYMETNAPELSVLVGLRVYLAAIPRHNAAFSYITGSGYPTSLK